MFEHETLMKKKRVLLEDEALDWLKKLDGGVFARDVKRNKGNFSLTGWFSQI